MDNFNENSIEKTFPITNVCRCCLAEGCYKDISTEYFISGKKEVYEEILKDVFNLEISYQKYGGPSRYSRLICENCIGKLRDAKEFKYKVVASEKSFIKFLDDMQINVKEEVAENNEEVDKIAEECAVTLVPELNTDNDVESCENDVLGNSQVVNFVVDVVGVKLESESNTDDEIESHETSEKQTEENHTDVVGVKLESESNTDDEIESHETSEKQTEENHTDVVGVKLESESNTDDEIESHETSEKQTEENHTEIFESIKLQLNKDLNDLLTGGANVCDKRKLSTESDREKKKPRLADEDTTKKRKKEPEKNKISEASGYALIRKNSLNLITNSTICVFQWNKSWYRCFICQEAYPELNALRQHSEEHTLQEIEEKIIAQQNRMVKVDVSQIICKLCKKQLQDLPDLRKHLTEAHKIRFEIEDDLLVPFKIDAQSLQCQLCSKPFDSFRLLNMHMNKHYQNHVCHICGATFSTLVFLNLHKTRSHRSWLCKECDVVFVSKADKKRHDVSVHKVKFERKLRFPCQHCGERFFQENYRAQHLVEKHGMQKPEYKCEFCGKVFITRSLCNNHVKNVHQKKKNHQCDICRQLFYTRSDVARHRVTHTKEKNFSCESCNSLFATKDSLRRHMKRTH